MVPVGWRRGLRRRSGMALALAGGARAEEARGTPGRAAGRPDRADRARISVARSRDHLSRRCRSCSGGRPRPRTSASAGARRQARGYRRRRDPVGGNPEGDVTLVEFFDYRCRLLPAGGAVGAASCSRGQDRRSCSRSSRSWARIWSWPRARRSRPSGRIATAVPLRADGQPRSVPGRHHSSPPSVGLDTGRLASDMSRPAITEINANDELARTLGIEGTPAFVIGESGPGRGRRIACRS